MLIRRKKKLEYFKKKSYIICKIPVTPLSFRANAHFGRVFSFIRLFYIKFSLRQANFNRFFLLWVYYGKI